ncbi:MAG TPA: hypothetical protein VK836_06260, partial [Streptosporangiaceae bacterium]|nr:hypothetical protein [Streptosporangiaceae bacterium]
MSGLSGSLAHGAPLAHHLLAHHLLAHHLLALAPALVPVLLLVLGLDVFCLVNLVRAKSVRNAPKLAWAIV